MASKSKEESKLLAGKLLTFEEYVTFFNDHNLPPIHNVIALQNQLGKLLKIYSVS